MPPLDFHSLEFIALILSVVLASSCFFFSSYGCSDVCCLATLKFVRISVKFYQVFLFMSDFLLCLSWVSWYCLVASGFVVVLLKFLMQLFFELDLLRFHPFLVSYLELPVA